MSQSTSTSLTKRPSPSSTALMPPPAKRIKRPPVVLDEDTYTSALSHIIARDFFPDMLETEAQQDFLDALDSRDADWIEDAGRKMQAAMTPVPRGRRRGLDRPPGMGLGRGVGGETPVVGASAAGWDTPASTVGGRTPLPRAGSKDTKEPDVDTTLSLAAFQAKYTSEDNASFYNLLDKQNQKRREKQPWLWTHNKLPSKQQIAQAKQRQRLLGTSINTSNVDDSTKNEENALIPAPQALDARHSLIDTRPHNPRNGLMFSPDDLETSHPTLESRAQIAQNESLAPPKSVNYSGTRLAPPPSASENSIPPSPSISAIDAAIAGRPHPGLRSPPSGSTVAPSEIDEDGSETPRVNGYAFVDEEPTPSELGISDPEEPATPSSDALLSQLIQSHGSSSPNTFEIKPSSRRETLHHAMVEKQLASKRKTSHSMLDPVTPGQAGRTPTPRFASSPRVGSLPKSKDAGGGGRAMGNLTPAARMLWHSIGAKRSAKEVEGSRGGMKRRAWTPTPVVGIKRAV